MMASTTRNIALLCAFFIFVRASAQQLSNYAFSSSVSTFTPLVGGTQPSLTAGDLDDGYANGLPIGFTFYYLGKPYTTLSASTNGFVVLGQNLTSSFPTNDLDNSSSVTPRPIIAPLWDNLKMRNVASFSYTTTGTIPNRVFTLEWLHVLWTATATDSAMSAQVKLYEVDGKIEFRYLLDNGAENASASIGLSGTESSLYNRPVPFISINETPAVAPTEFASFDSKTILSGKAFSFTIGSAPSAPTALTSSGSGSGYTNLQWIDNSTTETYFIISRRTGANPFVEIGRVSSTTKAATGGTYSFVSKDLAASTSYDYNITAANESNVPSSLLSGSFSTTAPSAISGTKTICTACDFPSIGAAFSEITSSGLSGAIILELAASYSSAVEYYPLLVPNGSATNTITLRPASGVTDTIRFVNTGVAHMFVFNNASYVSIDGRNGGAGTNQRLQFTNMDTTKAVFHFINASTNNTLRNNIIKSLLTDTASGFVHFATSSGATGNSNNTVFNNNFSDTLTLYKGTNAVYSEGSSGKTNDSITISTNLIHDFFNPINHCGAIVVGGNSSAWNITSNQIYQSAARTFTAAAKQYRGIYINNTSGVSFAITNNTIGYAANDLSGKTTITGSSNEVRPIYLNVGTTSSSGVNGNTVAGYSQTSSRASSVDGQNAFIGIRVESGLVHIGTVLKNTIGNMTTPALTSTDASIYVTTATSAPVVGISVSGASNDSIANNEIGSVYANNASLGFQGIRHSGTGAVVIYQNIVGGNILNSLVGNITANVPAVIGIATTSGVNTIIANTVQNITNTGANVRTASATGTIGISQSSTTAGQTVTNNLVYNIANTNTGTGAYGVIGVYYTGATSGTNEISKNKIRALSLNGSGTGAFIYGLYIAGGTSTFSNNEISVGLSRIYDTLTNPYRIIGVFEVPTAASNKYYYNSVLVLGTGVLNNNSTYAFFSSTTSGTRDYRNNVFANMRSFTDTSSSRNFVMRFAGTIAAGALPTATLNYNQYYFSGTGGSFIQHVSTEYATIAAWKAVFTAHDANSVVKNPQFNGADNLQSSSPSAINNALTIAAVTIDINNTTRTNFKMGAYDGFGDVKAPTIIHVVSTRRSSTTSDTIFATISDVSGVRSLGTIRPTAYYKKNSGTRHAALGTFLSGNGLSATWQFILDATTMGSLAVGDTIKYYIIAQDSVTPTANIASSPTGVVASAVDAVLSDPSVFNQVRIVDPLNNLFYIGESGECSYCDYESLTGAVNSFFADVNGGLLGSNTIVKIETDLAAETGAISLNQAGLGSFSLTIVPSDTATVVKTISNVSPLTTPLIKISAGGVSIDGRVNGSGRFLRFVNTHTTNTSAQSTIFFDETASRDTIQNCIIENNTATASRGCIAFGSNGTLSNFVIKRNIIRGAEGTPGTAGYTHSGIVGLGINTNNFVIGGSAAADSNDIYNFRAAGVSFTSSGNNHTIKNNNFYFTTGTATSTSNLAAIAINVVNGYGHNISNNSIGGSNKNRTGPAMALAASVNQSITGILLGASAIDSSIVDNNIISNFGQVSNNTAKNTIGINISSGKVRVSNNTIGGGASASDTLRSGAIGACINVSGGDVLIKNNIVGNLTYSGAGTGLFANAGIRSSAGNVSVTGNTIKNITAFSGQTTTLGAEYPAGIILAGTTTLATEISGNTIHDILATRDTVSASLFGRVYGIRTDNATATQSIYRNTIYNINTVAVTGGGNMQIVGISARGTSSPQTIHNNMISIVQTTGEPEIKGIETASTGTKNVFYNSVYVGGSIASGSTKCYAYYKEATTGTHVVRNNLFYTDRSGGSGVFLAAGIATTTTLTFSNNTLISTDSTKVGDVAGSVYNFSTFNANAIHTVGRYGLASLYPSATFFTAKNTANLANNSCVTNDGGTPVTITLDYNNTLRSVVNPDIGATEFSGTGISWLGVNTDYNSPLNWCGYNTPPNTIPITIPVTGNNPVLSVNTTIGDVTFGSGVKLGIDGKTLTLSGSLSGNPTFIGSPTSSLVITGTGNIGNINFDQTTPGTTNTLSSLTLNRGTNPATGSATLANALTIQDALVLTKGTLNTGGNLTLLSKITGTARIAPVITADATISGNIIAQRFLASAGRRWRFLGSPVSGTTISDWKNEVHITGSGGNANGFDSSLSNQASLYWYNETSLGNLNNGWTSPVNTSEAIPVGRGYRILIRGPRADGDTLLRGQLFPQNIVTLDVTGAANMGDIVMPITFTSTGLDSNDGWHLLGNPYASQISWNSIYDDVTAQTNMNPTVYVLDAVSTNGYVSFNASSNIGTLTNGVIPSGSAFFCKAISASPVPTLTIKEAHKVATAVTAYHKTESDPFSIKFYSDTIESDKFLFKPMEEASPLFDLFDIKKLYNANYDISSYGLDNINLSADCKPLLADTEIVRLSIRAPKPGNVFFDIDGLGAIDPSYSVWLIDNYTKTKTQITGSVTIPFTIDNNVLSAGDTRFVILLGRPASPQTALTKTAAANMNVYYYPNPVTDLLNIAYYNNPSESLTVTVSDFLGKTIRSSTHTTGNEGIISNDVSTLASGIYFLSLTNENGLVVSSIKVVK